MDPERFATLTRGISAVLSRRGLAGMLGLSAAGLTSLVEAKKKRKRKKKKKIKRNEFGCVGVGKFCKNHGQCCSGICMGREPGAKKFCRAHGTGTCDQEGPGFCEVADPFSLPCDGSNDCVCIRTTAGSRFCAMLNLSACADCHKDADCLALGFPAGSACVPFSEGICGSLADCGMACMAPCGYEPPESE